MSAAGEPPVARIAGVVLPPDEFAGRLDALINAIDGGSSGNAVVATDRPLPSAVRGADRHARQLHVLWGDVAPPALHRRPGARGRVVHLTQRTVRRLTWWYVEPRWTGQREFDAVTARFASDSASAIDGLRNEIHELRRTNDRLARQLYLLQLQILENEGRPPARGGVAPDEAQT